MQIISQCIHGCKHFMVQNAPPIHKALNSFIEFIADVRIPA